MTKMHLVTKPCPFCGGKGMVSERTECCGHGEYFKACTVICEKCYATGPWKDEYDFPKQDLKPLAIDAWNRRKV